MTKVCVTRGCPKTRDSGCFDPNSQTSKDRAASKAKKSALLASLGIEVTPNTVSKVDQIGDHTFTVNGRVFDILDNQETLNDITNQIYTDPMVIPSNYLVNFMLWAFPLDIDVYRVEVIAESLIRNPTEDGKYTLRYFLDGDIKSGHHNEHIEELILHTGLRGWFPSFSLSQQEWRGANFVILEHRK